VKKISFTRQTFGAIVVTAIGKIFAFIRTAVCASIFGATDETDAFYMATGMLTIISGPSASLTTVIVPLRTKIITEEGTEEADKFASTLLNLTLILAFGTGILTYILAPQLVKIFAPDFSGEIYTLTVLLVRIFIPLIVTLNLVSFFCGILNTHHRFVAANLIGLALNIGWLIVPLLLAARLGIFAMVWGYILGSLLQVIVLLPSLREVFHYRFLTNKKTKLIKQAIFMCLPVFIGTFPQQINQMVSRALASGLTEGSVSALAYAMQLITLMHGIILVPIVASIFSLLSALAQNNDLPSFKQLIMRGFSIFTLILLPVTVFSLIFNTEIVYIVFQRGAFDEAAGHLTRSAFIFYSLSFLPAALGLLLTRGFYALYDTKTPLYISLAGAAFNIILSLGLVRHMGIGGLALATSIASVVTLILLIFYLRQNIGPLGLIFLCGDLGKIVTALVVCTCFALAVKLFLDASPFMSLFTAALVGLLSYVVVLIFLKQSYTLSLLEKMYAKIQHRDCGL